MREFETPSKSLGDLNAELAARLIAAASDVALIIDHDGVIRDVAFGSEELLREGYYDWLGKAWADTVTAESRPKVEALLRDARNNAPPRWRHINHPSAVGPDLPLSYSAIALPKEGRGRAVGQSLVFGRDLRRDAALQQRLISAQQAMERDHWRLRHMETRYRSLFQVSGEAVLILDAANGKLEEWNPAAAALMGVDTLRTGIVLADCFDNTPDAKRRDSVAAMLGRVRATGHGETVAARLITQAKQVDVSASLFRQEKSSHLLIRIGLPADARAVASDNPHRALAQLIQEAPDAFVVTDLDGLILSANHAFFDLAQVSTEAQVRGQALERWIGRTGVDMNVLITNLRQRGSVRMFATVCRGEFGAMCDVEISGVAVVTGPQHCMGFTIRDVSRRLVDDLKTGAAREMPRSVGQMTELVGRMPLKDIVRDTTDLIEQLCIEAALELTHDNRASAAEMLGVSRQSLYVKMRRFSNGTLAPEPNDE